VNTVSSELFNLEGKIAFVTGASRGLGQAAAVALAEAGANVAVAARSAARLEETASQIASLGRQSQCVVMDATNLDSIRAAAGKVVERFGGVDILVNAAGMNRRKPSLEVTEDDWDTVIDTNLKSVFFCCQAVAPSMISRGGGKIINIASLSAVIGLANATAYASSRGGIVQMSKSLAVEWAKHNINVNCIGPGFFKTAQTVPLFSDPAWVARTEARTPMVRAGLPVDLAGAFVFLASAASDYITGQTVYVDGGFLAG
jgi:2-dehydro-3-deoxy-D-gluconate 5-dehydrogenase